MTTHDRWLPPGDGWVEYDGSGMPVDGGTPVQVLLREQRNDKIEPFNHGLKAKRWHWKYDESNPDHDGDIVAYRIVKER